MGMRIGGTGGASASQSASVSNWQQSQQNFKSLTSALQSGDLASAQKAYASLTQGNSNIPADSPLGKIGAALSSGDIGAAQQAMQAMSAGRGHHHHGGQAPQASTSSSGTTSTTNVTGPGSIINTTS